MICEKHGIFYDQGQWCGMCWREKMSSIRGEKKAKISELKTMVKTIEKKSESAKSFSEHKLKSFRSKSKYRNVTTEYNGFKYDSKLEAKVAQDLDWKLTAGEIVEWRRQVKIPLRVNEVFIANYYIDFIYTDNSGQVVYLEVKGLALPLWVVKWRLLIALINEIDPGAKLEVVKE